MKPDEARLLLIKNYNDRTFSTTGWYYPKIGFYTFEYTLNDSIFTPFNNVLAVNEKTKKIQPFQLAVFTREELGGAKEVEV